MILLNITTPETLARDHAALERLLSGLEPVQREYGRHDSPTIRGASLQVIGEAVDVILQQAAICGADFILVGSHGHSAFFEKLVGGTAAGVIRGAKCPVMIIPSPTAREELVRRKHVFAAPTPEGERGVVATVPFSENGAHTDVVLG
ncbi:MAG: universal stress protein [Opitutus sp.]